jgi:hypothetical protein
MRYLILFSLFLLVILSCKETQFDLDQKFTSLPEIVEKPWCYWYWINDDITKEGITKDLEAMKNAGIGAALIGNINTVGVNGKIPLFSEEWWEHMVYAVTEGHRIGVDIGVFNSSGWSQSGGPWVKPNMSMRYLAHVETKVSGPGKVRVHLNKPNKNFQDTHTLAFQTPESEKYEMKDIVRQISSNLKNIKTENLIDNNLNTIVEFNVHKNDQAVFNFQFKDEIIARKLTINPASKLKCECKLYAEIDGNDILVSEFLFDRSKLTPNVGPIIFGEIAISLTETKSDNFRLVCKNFSKDIEEVAFSEVNISEDVVLDHFIEKQLGKMYPSTQPKWDSYIWKTQKEVKNESLLVNEVLDVSNQLDENGMLVWDVPDGNWTIMRIGMVPTEAKNFPTSPKGEGYEIDKMSSELVKIHFDNFVGELLRRIPEESKTALKYVIADSYEVGAQNWTDNFDVNFNKKYGYNPVEYLPVLSGRIVGNVEESERFLWDLRRAIADNIAYEYVGGLRKVSNDHNLKLWLENYGHWGFPAEFMMYGGQSDFVSGEFWNEGTLGNYECKIASSTAHVYGKNEIFAEGFTAAQQAFLRHPSLLKKRGDWSFTQGINHLVLHLYIHQPDDIRKPGINAWFGTEFNRHNTWFKYMSGWTDYLRRCQLILKQGKYAADVCYYIGENSPIMNGPQIPKLPEGYSFDYINAETIINKMFVKDGSLVLPNGMNYKVMVLPPSKTMRPEVIKKLESLVKEGGIILGPPPEMSPSLEGYPECDQIVRDYADKLWGEKKNDSTARNYGKGKVFNGLKLQYVFKQINLGKDVDLGSSSYPVLWTHRILPQQDFYFITNQSDKEITFAPSFRVKEGKPQLWNPLTGEIRWLNEYEIRDGRIYIPLKLLSNESYFIVFDKRLLNDNNQNSYPSNFPIHKVIKKLHGTWQVTFNDKEISSKKSFIFPSLSDWIENTNENIQYYSGSATYKKDFNLNEINPSDSLYINLGNVQVISKVKLNGVIIGITWIDPHILSTKRLLTKGKNTIEIEVANLWRNQLIKEKTSKETERNAWWLIDDISQNEKLHSSGLLGPVSIECITQD